MAAPNDLHQFLRVPDNLNVIRSNVRYISWNDGGHTTFMGDLKSEKNKSEKQGRTNPKLDKTPNKKLLRRNKLLSKKFFQLRNLGKEKKRSKIEKIDVLGPYFLGERNHA